MFSTQVRQSKGQGFKSRSACFHVAKTKLSTLGTDDVPRGSDSTENGGACLSQNWVVSGWV